MAETKHKIFLRAIDALTQIDLWKQSGCEIVFTNGCFDILHLGHITYLEEASACGDKLVIGLNMDASVKKLKGDDRPIHHEESRAAVLAALQAVDMIILFSEETPLKLIKTITPDVLVKGGDYTMSNIVGSKHVREHGGVVKALSLIEGYSTSAVIDKILASKVK